LFTGILQYDTREICFALILVKYLFIIHFLRIRWNIRLLYTLKKSRRDICLLYICDDDNAASAAAAADDDDDDGDEDGGCGIHDSVIRFFFSSSIFIINDIVQNGLI
jgi:hypothetical protein